MHVNLWIPHCGSKTIEFLHLFHRQQYIPASTVYQIKLMSCPLVKKRDGGDLLARRAPPTNWASTSVDRRLRRHNNHLALTSPQKSMHLPNIMIFICTLYETSPEFWQMSNNYNFSLLCLGIKGSEYWVLSIEHWELSKRRGLTPWNQNL